MTHEELLQAVADPAKRARIQVCDGKTFKWERPLWIPFVPGLFYGAEWRLEPEPSPPTHMVPLGPEDIYLHRDLFRHSGVGPERDCCVADRKNENHLFVYDVPVTWEMARRTLEVSRDGGRTWQACEKESKE